MRFAVTGRPGIGKTTLCLKVFNTLKDKIKVAGFITREVRKGRLRVGFKIIDLQTGGEDWLARVGEGAVKVGKYAVFVDSVDAISDRINRVTVDENVRLVIIDEVGPMELKSKRFVDALSRLINDSHKPLLLTIHYKYRHWLLEKIRQDFKVYTIDERNRNWIAKEIIRIFHENLGA